MSVFEVAIDALFADPNMTVVGFYRPGGTDPALEVRVLRRQPDRVGEFGATRLRSETNVFELRTSEVADPREGDTLDVGGVRYVVQGEPMRDTERLVWTIEARPA